MFSCFVRKDGDIVEVSEAGPDGRLPDGTLWVDLVAPTAEEIELVERSLDLAIPSRATLKEIETSSRLFETERALFMTVAVLSRDAQIPEEIIVTFILTSEQVVTVREHGAMGFPVVAKKVLREGGEAIASRDIFFALLDANVDRLADRLEEIGGEIDAISRSVFEVEERDRRKGSQVNRLIRVLGRHGSHLLKARDSLMSLERLGLFMKTHTNRVAIHKRDLKKIDVMVQDVRSLTEHAEALDGKVNFLLDAMLGLIDLDQNKIMKIISILAALFLPPTLVSSIFGMNFQDMPALSWHYGFALSMGIMAGSSVVIAIVFRWLRWM